MSLFLNRLLGLVCLLLYCAGASAQDASYALVSDGRIQIGIPDVLAEAKTQIPSEERSNVLANPQQVSNLARTLYVRRLLAARAEAQGLADRPETAAALRRVRETMLAEAMLSQAVAAKLPDDASIEAQARANYQARPKDFERPEQIRVRHILLVMPQGDEALAAAVEKKAQDLMAQLRAGADFAKLAAEHSQDPASARRGGDLGFFGRRDMVGDFSQAAFALQNPGELAGPVRTRFGYHLLQFMDRKPAGMRSFEEVRGQLMDQIRAKLANEAQTDLMRAFMAEGKLNEEAIQAFVGEQQGAKP